MHICNQHAHSAVQKAIPDTVSLHLIEYYNPLILAVSFFKVLSAQAHAALHQQSEASQYHLWCVMQEAMYHLHQQLHPQLHHQLQLLHLLQAQQERLPLQLLPAQLEALLQLLLQLHPLEVEEPAQQLLLQHQQVQLSNTRGPVALSLQSPAVAWTLKFPRICRKKC